MTVVNPAHLTISLNKIKKMKKRFIYLFGLLTIITLTTTSCKDDRPPCEKEGFGYIRINLFCSNCSQSTTTTVDVIVDNNTIESVSFFGPGKRQIDGTIYNTGSVPYALKSGGDILKEGNLQITECQHNYTDLAID